MKKILVVILGLMASPVWALSASSTAGPASTEQPVATSAASAQPTAASMDTPGMTGSPATTPSTFSETPSATIPLPKPPALTTSNPIQTENTPSGEHFVFQFDASAIPAISSAAATQLGLGFGFDARISYAFDDFFSIGLESGFDDNSFNNSVLGAGSFGLPSGATASMTHIPLLVVFQIGMGDEGGPIQPYLILGAGLALDSYSLQNAAFPAGSATSWVNFEFDPGLGMAFVLSKGLNLFVQGKVAMDFDNNNSGATGQMADTPIITIPVQMGLSFNL